MLSTLCSQEGSKTEHLAASPSKAHGTATGEASYKPVLWSRVLPQARGGPWRVGWPRDLGEGREKSPEAGSRPWANLCVSLGSVSLVANMDLRLNLPVP